MTSPLGHTDLQNYIDDHHLNATILSMQAHTATVSDAAKALAVDSDTIIKSLVFMAEAAHLLVINNGLSRVDRKKLASYLGMNRKRVKFATAGQALEITGYVVGSMPPFGHRQPLRTLVDAAVTRLDVAYGGGGDIDAMMRVSVPELLKVSRAEIADLSEITK